MISLIQNNGRRRSKWEQKYEMGEMGQGIEEWNFTCSKIYGGQRIKFNHLELEQFWNFGHSFRKVCYELLEWSY